MYVYQLFVAPGLLCRHILQHTCIMHHACAVISNVSVVDPSGVVLAYYNSYDMVVMLYYCA